MAYIINSFNGSQLVTVEDGTVDTTTELKLIGKNFAGYGEQQNENFVFLLENFQGTVAPTKSITGQIWYDATSEKIRVYDGTAYKSVAGAEVSATQPTGLAEGDLWWNSTTNQLYGKNSNNEWNLIGPQATAGSTTEMKNIILADTGAVDHNVTAAYVEDYIVAIISEVDFVPALSQPDVTNWVASDFATLKAGYNLRGVGSNGVSTTDSRGNVNLYYGSAQTAFKLTDGSAVYSPSDFLQSGPTIDFTSSTVNFGDNGFTVGNDTDLTVKIGADLETPRLQLHRDELLIAKSDDTTVWHITNLAIYPALTGLSIGLSGSPLNNIYSNNFVGTATQANTLEVSGVYRAASTSAANNSIAARDGSGNITANIFTGTATQARYADLAEKYTTGDTELEPGTAVAVIADDCCEVGPAKASDICIGVVSTDPAIMMNSEADGQYIALKGRVPVKVEGPVKKGQAVYAWDNGICKTVATSALVGVALESNEDISVKLVECVLKV
jgi:hypothetical protein